MKLLTLTSLVITTLTFFTIPSFANDSVLANKEFRSKNFTIKNRRFQQVRNFSFSPSEVNSDYILRIINGDGKAPNLKSCKKLKGTKKARCHRSNRTLRSRNYLQNTLNIRVLLNGKNLYRNTRFYKISTYKDVEIKREDLRSSNSFKVIAKGFPRSRFRVEIYRKDSDNINPLASFTSNTSGLTVNLDASGSSDVDGEIESYQWDLGDGNSVAGELVQHTYATPGDYNVQLTVTDNRGGQNIITQTISVELSNQLPTGDFFYGHNNQALPMVMEFKALNAADADGSIVSYDWDFGDGNTASGENAVNLYFTTGSFTTTLTLTDDQGGQTVISKEITVDNNQVPVADFTMTPPGSQAPANITIDGSASSDLDGHDIISYSWKISDGREFSGQIVDVPFSNPGEYQVELLILDELHGFSTKTQTIIITESAAPVIVLNINNDDPTAPAVFEFDASNSVDPDGSIVSYDWALGDGNVGTGSIITHTYQFPGSYPLELRVTDDNGDQAIKTITIHVN